jgi:hypothetical protein
MRIQFLLNGVHRASETKDKLLSDQLEDLIARSSWERGKSRYRSGVIESGERMVSFIP